jgi:hypothetical protein
MGHGCSIGVDPQHDVVRREVAELRAIVAEHEPDRSLRREPGTPGAC